MDEYQDWHHLFGLSWADFFQGTAVTVEPEKDLSQKQQYLDLIILKPEDAPPLPRRLPDGFEDLGRYNLVTFKSYQEALDVEALEELIAHSVNYRKQVSPSMQTLRPVNQFRRFAVCIRSPHKLAQETTLLPVQPGVYEAPYFNRSIRVIVVHELPQTEHNSMLLLFSAQPSLIAYGAQHYLPHSSESSTLPLRLLARYREELIPMPETLSQLTERTINDLLRDLPRERVLQAFTPEELLKILPPEQVLQAIPEEKRLEGISVEKRLEGLTLEQLENRARQLREEGRSAPQQ